MQRTRLFAWIFGVPLGGVLVSGILAAHLKTQLPRALLNVPGHSHVVDSGMRQRAYASTTADVCGSGPDDQGVKDLCDTCRRLGWIRKASSASLLLGLFMVGAPWAAGLAARSNRRILLYLFTPGLYGTLVLTAVLIVLNAAIVVASAFCFPERFIGPVFPWLLLWLAAGGVCGAWILIQTLATLRQGISQTVLALPVSRAEQPELWAHVHQLAEKIGGVGPDNIVIGLEPRCFVAEADLDCLTGQLGGRTMVISLPVLRMLSLSEWSAVVSHELAHFKGMDAQFSKEFYPLYRGTEEALIHMASFSEQCRNPIASFVMLPGRAALRHYYTCFSAAESQISRECELAADAMAAKTSGRDATASALVKLHIYRQLWDHFIRRLQGCLKMERECAARQSIAFVDSVVAADRPKLIRDLLAIRSTDANDSHPTLSTRLAALGVDLTGVVEAARVIKPVDPAVRLLSEIDELDEELSQEHIALLTQEMGI